MYNHKFIIDADSLIKLTKSGMIKDICKNLNCLITAEVYEEAVTRGKERLHQDAFKIEKLVKDKAIKIIKTKTKEIETRKTLDEGEKSIYSLYKNSKEMTIVSDDNAFINFLKEEKSKFIVPASFITILRSMKKIDSEQSSVYLKRMKPYIKPKIYLKIKENIGGENDFNTTS